MQKILKMFICFDIHERDGRMDGQSDGYRMTA